MLLCKGIDFIDRCMFFLIGCVGLKKNIPEAIITTGAQNNHGGTEITENHGGDHKNYHGDTETTENQK